MQKMLAFYEEEPEGLKKGKETQRKSHPKKYSICILYLQTKMYTLPANHICKDFPHALPVYPTIIHYLSIMY